MTQLPNYNMYAVPRAEITDARMAPESDYCLRWEPLNMSAWYLCSLDDAGMILIGGPYRDERQALWHGHMMTDTSGT